MDRLIHVRISEAQHAALVRFAEHYGTTMSAELRRALDAHLVTRACVTVNGHRVA